MSKRFPMLFRFLVFVFLPLLVVVGYSYFYVARSLSPLSGDLLVAGLQHPVSISHDSYGVPHIQAKTDRDAYFALGFKHASDRLWQLEIQRRLAQGRLSEIFGRQTLQQDIWMRTLGISQAATANVTQLNKETLDALQAYSEGINAWVAQTPSLPLEFQLLGFRPQPWTVQDSLCWQKVFSLTLSGNMFDEMRRNFLQSSIGAAQLKFFYPYDPNPDNPQASLSPKTKLLADVNTLLSFGIGHPYTGSNAWVVSGQHTASGHPLLANDPHLGLQLPAVWYAASLKGDKLDASGMTLVGLPVIIFGQNSDIAWGGTSLEADQEDLFIETLSPQHPNQYLNNNEWKNFQFRHEKITIKEDFPAFLNKPFNPVDIAVRTTDRGPIISDVRSGADQVLSLRWTALDTVDSTLEAFFRLQYAKTWSEFRQSLSLLKSPGLNFVYADRAGNIGYQVAGMFPKRGQGVGILPVPATLNSEWQGYYDFSLLPSTFNPESGFIVSANEQVNPASGIVISHEWAPSARHDRITQLLQDAIAKGIRLTVDNMRDIQGDRTDLTALALLPYLSRVKPESKQEALALKLLSEWNGDFSPDSGGAAVFAIWSYYLNGEVFGKAIGDNFLHPEIKGMLNDALARISWDKLALALSNEQYALCKQSKDIVCEQELQSSLHNAMVRIGKITGTDNVQKWKWKDISRTELVHEPLGRVQGLESFFHITTHAAASPNSINASNMQFDMFNGFHQNFGASFRQVFELSGSASHWYMLSTGESGNPMSDHFRDMVVPFEQNKMIAFGEGTQVMETLNLHPRQEEK